MDNDKLIDLAEKFLRGEATEAEKQQLHAWYDSAGGEEERILAEWPDTAELVRVRILERMQEHMQEKRPKRVGLPRRRYNIAAAVVLLLLGCGVYFSTMNRDKPALVQLRQQSSQTDVAPGGNKAILTLANGSSIVLDSAHTGKIAQQGNTSIVKTDSGRLAYTTVANHQSAEIAYNLLAIPRGGQYQLVLPDGSKVWLDAASSIRYPTAFNGATRKVDVTGQVYFEVVKNASKPFMVNINGKAEVEVLGTSFNVNAYVDEPEIKTTLLEGAIRVAAEQLVGVQGPVGVNTNKEKLSVVLKPGQQAQLVDGENTNKGKDQIKIMNGVDPEAVMAWKNGQFQLGATDFSTLMRQISRWYNVDIIYEGKVPDKRFGGAINRNVNLSRLMEVMHDYGIETKIDGKQLIIMK